MSPYRRAAAALAATLLCSFVVCTFGAAQERAAEKRPAAAQQTSGRADRESVGKWRVGYAEADITPIPGEAFLSGFGRPRQAQGTLNPLRAQVLALEDATGRRALLFAADVLGFGRITVDSLRRKIQKAHGIDPAAVCFSASHTHWGPAINYRANFSIGSPNVWYLRRFEETLLKLADTALQDLSPAAVAFGACEVHIGMCRRTFNERGMSVWGPNPEGSYDPHTPVIQVTRSSSPKQLVVVGHACHPTSTGVVDKWSTDYPGAMRTKLESELDDSKAMFVQGCGGDAKVVARDAEGKLVFAADPQQSEAAGVKLAEQVLVCLRDSQLAPLEPRLEANLVRGSLSLREPKNRDEIETMALEGELRLGTTWWARQSLAYPNERTRQPYEVQAWRLGDLTLVALEGEVCGDWGPMTRALAGTKYAMTLGYANEVPCYIPTARIIREGGYEGETSHMSAYFLPAPFDPIMEVELTALIERALGRTPDQPSGSAQGKSASAKLLGVPYLATLRGTPATEAEKAETVRLRATAVEEWSTRRAEILANLQELMGSLPGPAFRVPLELEVVKSEPRDGYTQQTIRYNVDPYDRVESYLLIPDRRKGNQNGKFPAMLALHPTHPAGKDRAMGDGGDTGRQYAHELAQRGYVVIVPDYWPMGHYRNKDYDPHQRGYASGSLKGVWNHIRAMDVLQALPEVDPERIGSIGHSLGGYNTVFLGALDPRVKAMVTSAGYNSFSDYAASPYGGGDLAKWSLDKHLRRIRTVYDNDPARLPCDFPEIIAAIAPRPLLTIAPQQDDVFVLPGVVKCLDAARPVYDLLGARDNLQSRFPEGGHDFAQTEREAAYAFLDKFLKPSAK